MKNVNNILKLNTGSIQKSNIDINDEIIDDTALIDCINQLNSLKARDEQGSLHIEQDILSNINRISAEMSWFSQWLTVKSNSAA